MTRLLFKARQAAKEFVESSSWRLRPQTINFEITAACDAKCVHCPRQDMDRPMKAMPQALFRKMVDEAKSLGVPALCPNGYGEICTLPIPWLKEYLEYITASQAGFRILINTNGYRMNEERSRMFIEHKVHLINVTIDGASAAVAESIRVGLKFDTIEENIRRLIRLRNEAGRKYPRVRVGMISMPQNRHEEDSFMRKWEGLADFCGMGGYSSRLDSVSSQKDHERLVQLGSSQAASHANDACVLPFRDMNVWADGKVVICCEDWNEEHVVGDLNEQSLAEIWRGPRFSEIRRKHRCGQGNSIPACAKCTAWQKPSLGARLWV